ncbi:MAG: CBS domain-containing protein [Candidatus Helarchaeota archaeon]|nr:CBS domain-containing protein [Candidatus Helarchaeota archaeon]
MAPEQKSPKNTFKDIASKNVFFCDEEDTVSTIARKMQEYWTDTIFVQKKSGKVTGMITDGIIWNLIAIGKGESDPRKLKAKEIMFKNFIRVNWDEPIDSIDQVRELLDKRKIQRIGLVKEGQIVGLVRKKFIERVKRFARNFSFELK